MRNGKKSRKIYLPVYSEHVVLATYVYTVGDLEVPSISWKPVKNGQMEEEAQD